MFSVAKAEVKDIGDIVVLLEELDRYYGGNGDEPREVAERNIRDALFGDLPAGAALVVHDEQLLVGLACYSFLWPAAGTTRSLYLKELYVAESHRGLGVGKLLMNSLLDAATKYGCSRVEWTADESNPTARAFYEAQGFSSDASKLFYRAAL